MEVGYIHQEAFQLRTRTLSKLSFLVFLQESPPPKYVSFPYLQRPFLASIFYLCLFHSLNLTMWMAFATDLLVPFQSNKRFPRTTNLSYLHGKKKRKKTKVFHKELILRRIDINYSSTRIHCSCWIFARIVPFRCHFYLYQSDNEGRMYANNWAPLDHDRRICKCHIWTFPVASQSCAAVLLVLHLNCERQIKEKKKENYFLDTDNKWNFHTLVPLNCSTFYMETISLEYALEPITMVRKVFFQTQHAPSTIPFLSQ